MDAINTLNRAVEIIMNAGHRDVADSIVSLINRLSPAMYEAKIAMASDSFESDCYALCKLMEALQ
jgi:hypothetical protein